MIEFVFQRLFAVLLLGAGVIVLGSAASASPLPDRQAHIYGVVEDAGGAVIPQTRIRLVRETGLMILAVADDSGAFHINLPAGHYRLSAVSAGFQQKEEAVDLAPGVQTHLLITLKIQGKVESVTVTAETGYAATVETTATRVPMPMLDVPQSVYTVTQQALRDRDAESLKDAVAAVPGVEPVLGEGRRDQFAIRGFSAGSDLYLDGVRDDAQYYRDLSNTDRVEVVEGPAAVLYGRGSSGGLINRVTKKPRMEGLQGELSFTGGSYGDKRVEGDLEQTWLGGKLGGRVTGAGESSGSQRHYFYMNRYAFAPILRWKPSNKTDVYGQIERLRDERLPDRGVAAVTGPRGEVPIGNYYGYAIGESAAPHDFIHESAVDETLSIRHEFDGGWHAHNILRHAGDLIDWSTTYLNEMTINGKIVYGASVAPRGVGPQRQRNLAFASPSSPENPVISRGQYNASQVQRNLFDEAELWRSGHFLGLGHLLLVGAEYGRQTMDRVQFTGTAPSISLYNPAPDLAPAFAAKPSTNNRFFGQTAAVYTQDLIQLAAKWKLLAGVRFDSYKQYLDNRLPDSANLGRIDNDWSPRAGLLYQPASWSTLYFSYSRNFDPSGESLNLAANAAQLAPEKTQNFEGGAKFLNLGQRLLTTVSVYRLDRDNIKTINPQNPSELIEVGEQRTDGASLSFQGSPTEHWTVLGGYAWQDARIIHSNSSTNGVPLEGRRPLDVPVNSGSLWSIYRFANGFGAGGGLVSRGDSFAANDNLVPLPGYTRLDATMFYHWQHFEADAHLDNLTNTRYYDSSHSDLELYPGAPISGGVVLRYRF